MSTALLTIVSFSLGFALAAFSAALLWRRFVHTASHQLDNFKALATESLKSNNELFLTLAEQRLRQSQQANEATLDKKATSIMEFLTPMKDSLLRLDTHVQAIEVKREGAYRELVEMVRLSQETQKQLRQETSQLLQALRSPTARGTWGQMQLKRILEMAGMTAYTRDFTEQKTITTSTAVLRPDFVISLPGERCVIIDSKVPLTAFLQYTQSEESRESETYLAEHARAVRDHVRALASKDYWSSVENSPEFVVLFIPGDHLLAAALNEDPNLMDYAINQRVVLATPTTVLALLWSIAYGWKQEALRDNVRQVGELGLELHNALSVMIRHFTDLGGKLTAGIRAYNDTVGSLEKNVLSKARRLREYGAHQENKTLPDTLPLLEEKTRSFKEEPPLKTEDAA